MAIKSLHLTQLPQELIVQIFLHSSVTSLKIYRAVCKLFQSIIAEKTLLLTPYECDVEYLHEYLPNFEPKIQTIIFDFLDKIDIHQSGNFEIHIDNSPVIHLNVWRDSLCKWQGFSVNKVYNIFGIKIPRGMIRVESNEESFISIVGPDGHHRKRGFKIAVINSEETGGFKIYSLVEKTLYQWNRQFCFNYLLLCSYFVVLQSFQKPKALGWK
jgi:hypothetical protein